MLGNYIYSYKEKCKQHSSPGFDSSSLNSEDVIHGPDDIWASLREEPWVLPLGTA